MSSAILYLAIIAIWACVLIPRWLRRDSARGLPHSYAPAATVSEDVAPDEDVPGGQLPVSHDEALAEADYRPADPAAQEQESAPPPLSREESRRRMMAARRRLLGMLIALEVAAIGLALLGFAALWVVIPPTVMFGGYLLLLREVAHADAERSLREQEEAWARARALSRARAAASAPLDAPVASAASAASAAPAAPAEPAVGFEGSGPGRDFAPGLAGKYTTSNAEAVPAPDPADYDQYTANRLRAVGD